MYFGAYVPSARSGGIHASTPGRGLFVVGEEYNVVARFGRRLLSAGAFLVVRRRIGYCLPGSFHAACGHLLVAVVGGGALECFDYVVVVNLVGAQDYVALLLLEPLEVVDFFGAVVVGNLFFIYGFAADIGVGRACGRPDVVVESVHFSDSLLTLSYLISQRENMEENP